MNQWEFDANTRTRRQAWENAKCGKMQSAGKRDARENAREQVMIGLGFDWLRL